MSVKNIIGVVLLCLIIGVPFGFVIHEIGWGEFLAFLLVVIVEAAVLFVAGWCLLP